jgi:hypothetical protein
MDELPNLPAMRTLQALRQWLCWRWAERDGRKTKIPMSPHNGLGASVTNPAHWGTYDQAMAQARRRRHDGVGFVLTETDGLTGVDLDHCRDPKTGQLEPWAQEILDLKETYAEISISGTGVHLFWRGKVAKTFKDNGAGVEVYRSARYLIVTGHHVRTTPADILTAPRTEAILRARVEAARPTPKIAPPSTPKLDLSARGQFGGGNGHDHGPDFFREVNTAALTRLDTWVPALHPEAKFQPGTAAWRVSSADLGRPLQEDISYAPTGIRDFGLEEGKTAIDMVIEYGAAADAVKAAFWLCERLGMTPESLGWDDGAAVAAAGAEIAKSIISHKVEAKVEQNSMVGEFPTHLLNVPGLVGDIAKWITDTSIMPQPILSLGAAVTVVGTAAGRHLAGPSKSGTHLYVIGLAPSGAGKDWPRSCIGRVLKAAGLKAHLGPGGFGSTSSIIKVLTRQPLSVCRVDEFGAFLGRVNSFKAGSHESEVLAVLRKAWGASFDNLPVNEYATYDVGPIEAPSLSIYGVSTREEFYAGLKGPDVINGFLNRFLLFQTSARPEERVPPVSNEVPVAITTGLKAIYDCGPLNMLLQSTVMPVFKCLDIAPDAAAARMAFIREIRAMEQADPSKAPFLARTAENAIRLATIVAIGRGSMTVEIGDMTWAREVAMWSTRKLAEDAAFYIADSETQQIANALRRAIWPKRISRMRLIRGLNHRYRTPEMENVLKAMAEAGEITVERTVPGPNGGPPTTWYTRAHLEDQ